MKNRISILFLALIVSSSLHSQSPQGIPYQAVMRNADGSVMASSEAVLTFMIHDGAANGTVVYQESHSLTSNAQGLVSCVVGNGVVSQGSFSNINWGSGGKFLHVMMNGNDLGTQQMLSVPYALFAGSTNVSVSSTGDTLTVGGQSVIVPGISAANPPSIYTQGTGVTDIDGNSYTSIIINGQEWMQQNLAVTKYRNGDPIPTGLSDATWQSTTSGAYAIYNNDAANNTLYGKLYNWYAVNDSRGLCPTGWHVPSDAEWTTLETYLGGSSVAGGKMKATTGWNSPNTGATNESGFTGLPGGARAFNGTFVDIGNYCAWLSTTEANLGSAWFHGLDFGSSNVIRQNYDKRGGLSVRCVKDSETLPIQGCTDGAACNFLANANQDDGSCMYQNATCDDGNASTINDVINGSCMCAGSQTSGSGTGAQLLPGNATCATQNISVTGCGGQTSLTYDGQTYDLVEIGGQCWFADNLATDQYRNGDLIPTGLDNATWLNTTAGAYAIYNNDLANDATYGKLYNWYTTVDSRGLCPTGWHVPTDCEWMYMEGSLGMSVVDLESIGNRGNNEGGALKSATGWDSPNTGATNSSGFNAPPGGHRYNVFANSLKLGQWWTNEEFNSSRAWYRQLNYFYSKIYRDHFDKQWGISVRCVRD